MTQEVGAEALDLLTIDEVALRLRISPDMVKRLCYSGKLRSCKVGSLRRIAPEAIVEYKESIGAVAPRVAGAA